jgi:hypothetical protein
MFAARLRRAGFKRNAGRVQVKRGLRENGLRENEVKSFSAASLNKRKVAKSF